MNTLWPTLIRAMVIPAGVVFVSYIISRIFPTSLRALLRSTALAAAIGLSFLLMYGWPELSHRGGLVTALFVALFFVSIWPLFEADDLKSAWLKRFFACLVVLTINWLPQVRDVWTDGSAMIFLSLGAFSGLFAWTIFDRAMEEMHSSGANIGFSLWALMSSMIFWLAKDDLLAVLSLSLSAVMFITSVLAFLSGLKIRRESLAVFVLLMTVFWASHWITGQRSWSSYSYVLAPIIWYMLRDLISLRMSATKDFVFTSLIVLIPLFWSIKELLSIY